MRVHSLLEYSEKTMQKIEIFRIDSLSRAPLVVHGYLFKGSNPKAPSIAVVGAMEGNSILPLYCASSLVDFLNNKIDKERIEGDILIIPSINHYALNIGERYWPLDKTNLNMMFPGYGLGETTQRIAQKLFDAISHYNYGISLETRVDQAHCIPHIKLLKSGYEDIESAQKFGFKIIHHKDLESTDTVSLQYNWQLWGAKAYSIVCPSEQQVDTAFSNQILQAMLRFMGKTDIIDYKLFHGYQSNILQKESIEIIKSPRSGIFIPYQKPGHYVSNGQAIGEVVNALEGNVVHKVTAPCDGMITCMFSNSLILENAVAFRIAKIG